MPDLLNAGFVVGRLGCYLNRSAVFCQKEVVRGLLLGKTHSPLATLVHVMILMTVLRQNHDHGQANERNNGRSLFHRCSPRVYSYRRCSGPKRERFGLTSSVSCSLTL